MLANTIMRGSGLRRHYYLARPATPGRVPTRWRRWYTLSARTCRAPSVPL